MKQYNVKLYDLSWAYVRTFSPKEIMGEIRFSAQTDGGQGELRLKLSYGYDSAAVSANNVVKVFQVDDANPSGRQIYSGVVGSVRRVIEKSGEYVEARVVGASSALSWLFYKSGESYSFTKLDDPANVVKSAVDVVAALYPGLLTYDSGSVLDYGSNVNLSFSYEKCLDAVKKTCALTNWWWTVDWAGKLHFKPKSSGSAHHLTFGRDVEAIEIEEITESVVNDYFLSWLSGTANVSDAASQAANGKRQFRESKTEILDSWTAANAGNDYISANKDPKKRIVVTVNQLYDFEAMKPGDLVTVRNIAYPIQSLQILKLDYSPQRCRLELESVRSLQKSILQ